MALPPTIPTSFVPKQPVETGPRHMREGTNLFITIGAIVIGVSILAAGLTFGYEKYLQNVRDAKSSQLADEEKKIDQDTVEGFIRLQNRLTAAGGLLDRHILLSQFFDLLESLTLQNVRFSTLQILVSDDRSAQILMTGTAKSFNALAAESSAFAGEKRIKSAIFSQIKVNTNNTVAFSVTADLDPRLLLLDTSSKTASTDQTTADDTSAAPSMDASSTESVATTTSL